MISTAHTVSNNLKTSFRLVSSRMTETNNLGQFTLISVLNLGSTRSTASFISALLVLEPVLLNKLFLH